MKSKRSCGHSIDEQMVWALRILDSGSCSHFRKSIRGLDKNTDNSNRMVRVFDPNALEEARRKGGSDELKRELRVLADEQNNKPLACVDDHVLSDVEDLKAKFPNFSGVIEHIRKALQITMRSQSKKINLQPILLIGPPGLGKTRFLTELGNVLRTGLFNIDMSTVSAGFVLSGNSSQWGNSKPGFVSDSMRKSEVANPLMLVDEIDKAKGDSRHDPLSSFYGLLQDHSAVRFVDEFLGIPFDCSHINWVASANYIERIEPAILSRMKVMQIDFPTPEQTRPIVKNIYEELLVKNLWQEIFEPELSTEVVDMLSSQVPRMIEQLLVEASHNAFDRTELGQTCAITVDDIEIPNSKGKRRIGFIQD